MEYIIYEDSHICVCHKPSGLAVQNASFGRKDLESILKTYYFEQTGKPNPYLGIVHRLDQPVQGLVVFARNPRSAASLSAQVQDGRMKKYYQAVTCGIPEKKSDRLIHYLKKNGKTNLSEVVSSKTVGAKKAELQYHILKEKEQMALAEIELFTGRHHQIRLQLAGMGTPIVGDRKYGKSEARQLGLCSYRIAFVSPTDGKACEYEITPKNAEIYALFEKKDKA